MKKIGIKQMTTVTAFLAFSLLLMFPTDNIFAQVPTVQITSSQPRIAATAPYTQLSVPVGQSTVRVTFDYVGIEGNDRLREFQCTWFGLAYASETCPNIISGQNTYRMTGRVTRDVCAGQYIFGVKVLNSGPNPNPNDPSRLSQAVTRQFTVTRASPITTSLDPTGCPVGHVYKANSYLGPVPTSGENQYHFLSETETEPTRYNNMYIVFEGFYPTGTGVGTYRSDIRETGARTTFECRWDSTTSTTPFVPCRRHNIITNVSPGVHTVEYKAINANGAAGNSDWPSSFSWCVRPQSLPNACEGDGHPTGYYHAIPAASINNFISEEDVKFTSGKNETILLKDLKDMKELLIPKGAADTNNTIIYLKSPILNETIGTNASNTIQNKTMSTNATNVTSFGPNDTQVTKADNASLIKGK